MDLFLVAMESLKCLYLKQWGKKAFDGAFLQGLE